MTRTCQQYLPLHAMPVYFFFVKTKAILCTFKKFSPTFYAGSRMVMVLVRRWLGTLPTNPSLRYRACIKIRNNTCCCHLAPLPHLQPPWEHFALVFTVVCGCTSLSHRRNIVTASEAAIGRHSCAHEKRHTGVALILSSPISDLLPPPHSMCYIWHSTWRCNH